MRIVFVFLMALAMFCSPGCVSKEQHKTLTESFRAYYDESHTLVEQDIEAQDAPESVKQARRNGLRDVEEAIKANEVLAGIRKEEAE